jgi:sugar phosphate isomerase/epimerase
MQMNRRTFLGSAAAAAANPAAADTSTPLRLGIDLFSVRTQRWSPFEMLDYCARGKVNVAFFSEIRFLGGLEKDNLAKVRAHARKLGIDVEIGMKSICPTSGTFDAAQGTAEAQLGRMITAAKTVGSPLVRAVLGSSNDRAGEGGIERHIENTVRVLRNVRSQAVGEGIKIAMENHSGDMQARELKMLIEAAGKDFVGACLDSGNPVWAIEDPHLTLEVLAPYTLTSHIRDSYLWRVPEGVAVRWVRMGEGNVNILAYMRKFAELCPGKALALEVIVTGPRVFRCMEPSFWKAYRNTPAWEFARFLAIAETGKPQDVPKVPREQAAQRELEDLEASLLWVHKNVG